MLKIIVFVFCYEFLRYITVQNNNLILQESILL